MVKKEKKMTISYTFNGKIDRSDVAWDKWIIDALAICTRLGCEATHYSIGVIGEKGKIPGRLSPISGLSRKIAHVKKKGETISGLTLLVLPANYKSVAFDFIITLSRNASYITLIINQKYVSVLPAGEVESVIVDRLQNNIDATDGERYEMEITDCPEFYAGKANPQEFYKSLKNITPLIFEKKGT